MVLLFFLFFSFFFFKQKTAYEMRISDWSSDVCSSDLFLRGAALPDVPEVLVVTNRELFFKTEDEFSELGKPAVGISYILEPFGRNTAAAVASAALRASRKHGGGAVLLVLAADHLISEIGRATV